MSIRIPPGYAEAWLQFTIATDPEPMYTSLGVGLASGITPSVAATNNILDVMTARIGPLLGASYVTRGSHVLWGQDAPDDVRIDGTGGTVNGTGSAPLPNNTAMLVKKSTTEGGRRGRGRMFIPGIQEASVDDAGVIAAATRTLYQTELNTMLANLVGLPEVAAAALFRPARAAGPGGVPPFLPGLPPAQIVGLTLDQRVATQRRRMRR